MTRRLTDLSRWSEHYLRILRDSYAERLRVVFEAEDFSQLFRLDGQQGLFDRPIEQMQLRWIRCIAPNLCAPFSLHCMVPARR